MISLNATFIIQVVNFLLLMWALNRLLFRPILKNLEEREERIERLAKNTEALSLQAKETKKEHEKKVRQAQTEALEEKEKARSESAGEAERFVKKALSEAERGLAEARGLIAREAEKARREFGELSREISVEIYRKILGTNK